MDQPLHTRVGLISIHSERAIIYAVVALVMKNPLSQIFIMCRHIADDVDYDTAVMSHSKLPADVIATSCGAMPSFPFQLTVWLRPHIKQVSNQCSVPCDGRGAPFCKLGADLAAELARSPDASWTMTHLDYHCDSGTVGRLHVPQLCRCTFV